MGGPLGFVGRCIGAVQTAAWVSLVGLECFRHSEKARSAGTGCYCYPLGLTVHPAYGGPRVHGAGRMGQVLTRLNLWWGMSNHPAEYGVPAWLAARNKWRHNGLEKPAWYPKGQTT